MTRHKLTVDGNEAVALIAHRLSEMRGNMNLSRVPDPDAYERANYMLMLQSWKGW